MYQVFGPKIVATRGGYDDRGLESRFITEQTDGRNLRADIPINLPSAFEEEALALRNKLLLYRFEHWGRYKPNANLVDPSIEPRLNQIFVPLLSIVDDEDARDELRKFARQCNERRSTQCRDIQSDDIIWEPLDDGGAEKI